LFAKAVQALDHDLFAPRGYFDAISYVSVFPNSDTKSTSTSASADGKKGKKGKKATGAAPAEKAKVFPAGSCVNHLTSTSHDTSMCNKGK
jgi:hypothetical protein